MLKTQITGAKYLSPQTNQMTNLNIAVPADSKDTKFGTSDIMLAKDVVAHYYTKEETDNQIQIAKNSAINIHNEDNTKSIKLDINDTEAAEDHESSVNVSLIDDCQDYIANVNAYDGFRHSSGGGHFSNLCSDGLDIFANDHATNICADYIYAYNSDESSYIEITTNKELTDEEQNNGHSPIDISLTDGDYNANINAKHGFIHKTDDGFVSTLDGYALNIKNHAGYNLYVDDSSISVYNDKDGRQIDIRSNTQNNYLCIGSDKKFKISRPADNTEGATITGVKSIAAFSNPSATKVWATDGSTVDLTTKANTSDLDAKANKSDVLLAEDTAALVADAKRTILEGEKTILLAPTYIDSNIELNEEIDPTMGKIHIKMHFDLINIQKNAAVNIMSIGEHNVSLFMHTGLGPCIFVDDNRVRTMSVHDKQFEITIYNDYMRFESGSEGLSVQLQETPYEIMLHSSGDGTNQCSYTCEIFQNIPIMNMSDISNDDGYLRLKNNDLELFSVIKYPNLPAIDGFNEIMRFASDEDEVTTSIYANASGLVLPKNTYIHTDEGGHWSLSAPIYKIVNSLPTSEINSRNIYMIKKTDPTESNVRYDKYIYIDEDSAWEKIG